MICDVCGAEAWYGARDLVETAPLKDSEGQLWSTFAYDGPPRYGCKKHKPSRTRTRYLGTPPTLFAKINCKVIERHTATTTR